MVRIDLAGEPSPELCKEVYAHYGLCMAIAQGFETHLVNMVTLYATTNSPEPVQSTYLRFEAEFQKLTFGNLIKALSKYDYLDSLELEVSQMKQTRDFLAHRFFRERSSDFVSVGGCEQLIQELNAIRIAFDQLGGQGDGHRNGPY